MTSSQDSLPPRSCPSSCSVLKPAQGFPGGCNEAFLYLFYIFIIIITPSRDYIPKALKRFPSPCPPPARGERGAAGDGCTGWLRQPARIIASAFTLGRQRSPFRSLRKQDEAPAAPRGSWSPALCRGGCERLCCPNVTEGRWHGASGAQPGSVASVARLLRSSAIHAITQLSLSALPALVGWLLGPDCHPERCGSGRWVVTLVVPARELM